MPVCAMFSLLENIQITLIPKMSSDVCLIYYCCALLFQCVTRHVFAKVKNDVTREIKGQNFMKFRLTPTISDKRRHSSWTTSAGKAFDSLFTRLSVLCQYSTAPPPHVFLVPLPRKLILGDFFWTFIAHSSTKKKCRVRSGQVSRDGFLTPPPELVKSADSSIKSGPGSEANFGSHKIKISS